MGDSFRMRGILHFIGQYDADPYRSKYCLGLLAKLLNYEKHNQAELYIKVFCRQELSLIKSMRLEYYLKKNCSTKDHALRILNVYLANNSRISDIRYVLSD